MEYNSMMARYGILEVGHSELLQQTVQSKQTIARLEADLTKYTTAHSFHLNYSSFLVNEF